MKRLFLALLATTAASPALAQHGGHGQPAPAPAPPAAPPAACTPEHAAMGHCTMQAPAPTPAAICTAEHAAMGHCTMPAPAPTPPPTPAATCAPEHAAIGHCTPSAPAPTPSPAQTCSPEHAAMGHCTMPAANVAPGSADPHAGHQMGGAPAAAIPVAPPPAEALSGPAHAQDLFFDPGDAARSRAHLTQEHGGMTAYKLLIDQLEVALGDGGEGYSWDAQFWYGGDIDKFWLKTEGEGAFGEEFEGVEVQALWSHAINPWFDLQAGVRQDIGAGPDRTHLVLGVQGLAPYWFEVEGAVFLSTEGDLTARVEAEYDLRLTQEVILQPLVEVDFSLQDVPELGIGSGITTAEVGARLRYEFFPRSGPAVIAPYVGVVYERAFGRTEDFRVATGDEADGVKLVVGVRTWF